MRKNHIFVAFVLLLTAFAPQAWAECYVLNESSESSFSIISSKVYNINNQNCDKLYFSAKRTANGKGELHVAYTTDGTNWIDVFSENPGEVTSKFIGTEMAVDYKDYGPYAIDRKATQIKFYTKTGATLSKYFKNIKVTQATYVESSASTVDCGTVDVGGSSQDAKFSVNWSNVNALSLSIDNTTDFSLNTTNIAAALCSYGSAEITVDFHPTTKGNKTAKVTVYNSDKQSGWTTIVLKGYAKPEPQQIVWWDDEATMLSRGDVIESPFAMASSGLALTELKSSDESVLKIDENGQLIAVAAGKANIIACQAGSETIDEVRDTLHLEVTNLLTQKISWTQPLNFKWGDAATTLTAESSVGLPITYEIVDNANNVVSLSDGVLTISTSNTGTATIRAIQVGNDEYAATSYVRTVRVRNPNASCLSDPFVCDETAEKSFRTINSQEYTLDGSPAGQLSFDAKCEAIFGFWGGDLYVKQYINGSWSGKIATCKFDKKNTYYHFGPFDLDRRATKIQLFTETGATGYKVFKNVQVTRAHFVEANVGELTIDAQYGTTTRKTVTVTYSNLQDLLNVALESENDEFSVTPATIGTGDCGEYGTAIINVSYTPSAIESDVNALIISNEKDATLRIPISTSVSKRNQNLSWQLRDSIATTQTWILNKVNPVSGLPIFYEISDETALTLDENNQLVFLKADPDAPVTITATCPGNDEYNDATPISLDLKIFKGIPQLTLPTVGNEITYGQTLSEVAIVGGKATTVTGEEIEGDFMWTNKNIVPNAGSAIKQEITFVPYNQTLYDNAHDTLVVTVNRQTQKIVWSMTDSVGVMDNLTLDAYATSKLPVSYAIEPCSGQAYAKIEGDGTLNITATADALDKELIIKAWQAGDNNYLPSDTVIYSVILRKTRAEFFAATRPITVSKGGSISLSDVEVHVESSVAGTWQFNADTPTTFSACLWIAKGTFTPANLELCEPIEVEIPINITEE